MAKFWSSLKKGPPAKNAEPDMLYSPSSFVAVPNGTMAGPSIYSFDDERNPIVDAPLHEFVEHKYPASAHENEPLGSPALSDAMMGTRLSTTSQSQPSCPLAITASVGDFEFMEIALEASLNQKQVDTLLDLIGHVLQKGPLRFSKHTVVAAYKKEVWTYKVHTQPIWEWALDILALHFIWDAQCLFKHDGHGFECFYDEPWMGNSWWDIQSSLPKVLNAVPFAFIIYANKTKLSSFGTAKGYPVVVHCANLLVEIQNSHAIGGGCICWMVPEDAEEEGKLGYTTLNTQKLGISIYYEEQCMMSLIYGHTGKCPCPVCLIPLEELHNISKTYLLHSMDEAQHSHTEGEKVLKALRLQPVNNVFWLICNSDLYGTLSFDCLHFLHGGLWGKHILWDILRILNVLGCNAETNNVINVTFSDGNKMCDLAKAMFYVLLNVFTRTATPKGYCLLCILASYLQLDSLIEMIDAELLKFNNKLKAYIECVNKSGLEGLQVDWDFPKILCVDKHKLAAKLLRMCVDSYKNWTQMQGEPAGTEGECNDNQSGLFTVFDHVYLSSSSKLSTIQDIEASCSVSNTAFVGFHKKLSGFCNQCLPQYGYQVDKWITIPTHFKASDLLMNFFKLMPGL
ncbi:hypothetical protein F5J12DRAFT_785722 [Pisolithus orientalis]|uniref:uncharacterized protein n=1 Tax=Pisolithus orientalis TaxID=936130 RepID=UPI002224ACC3|nr:uncharacterized protein F5J12DRAFT_785722 [Pisolithus orientalis]KAI5994925.1 hypothetical protein F5J12DRAFT_785722 [Pisolithus orientalis]